MSYPPQGPHQPHDGPPRRTGLIAVIGGVLAVVIVAVVLVVVMAQGNDDGQSSGPSAPRTEPGQSTGASPSSSAPANAEAAALAVGKAYAAAVNRSDKQAATNLTCEKTSPGVMYEAGAGEAQYRVGAVEIFNPTKATVDMITVGASGRGVPLPFSLGDTWCVAV